MKKIFVAFAAVMAIGLASCNKVLDAFFNPIESPLSVNITVPVITNTSSEISLGTSTVQFNLDSIIKANTRNVFSLQNIKSVKIKDIAITLNNATTLNNLQNFESVRITFHTNTNATPITIGAANIPNTYAESIVIPVTNSVDIKNYLDGTQITFNLWGKARKVTTMPLQARIGITLRSE